MRKAITVATITAMMISLARAQDGPAARLDQYATFRLEADTASLSDAERQMIPHLIRAAEQMDRVFWQEAWGSRESLEEIVRDESVRRYVAINYGPWDRLDGNAPFLTGVGPKPKGARFYPEDMTIEEFERVIAAKPSLAPWLESLYTLVRRDAAGQLTFVPYSIAFRAEHLAAATELLAAAELAEDAGLKRYLELRADALLSNHYRESDLAWMEMTSNRLDIVIGPIETYEDQLFGYKAAHEAYVLVKDLDWSARLERYAAFLPELQRGLPVPDRYKQETPGGDAQLNAYDVIYYAGDCNAGSKTIAINLPNDEAVQLEKGTRRLQLKNAMRAKFDRIMVPITGVLISPEQRKHVTFDAFFGNTMFHEVAHGLGIKSTLDGRGTVREALKEQASAVEEGKADILGLYMVSKLHEKGELGDVDLKDNYVTFLAGIFRSVRFGASSAHGRANMMRFNFFQKAGAFARRDDGTYAVDFARMRDAMTALSLRILTLQGDGDYTGAKAMMDELGQVGVGLGQDLDRLTSAGIPVDIVFEQGLAVLGLQK